MTGRTNKNLERAAVELKRCASGTPEFEAAAGRVAYWLNLSLEEDVAVGKLKPGKLDPAFAASVARLRARRESRS